MPQIIFVRHGQSVANVNRQVSGWFDVELTETGEQQARAAASELVGLGVTRVVASDLVRAQRTGQIIADALALPLEIDRALREQHFGELEGRLIDELEPIETDAIHAVRWGGGESLLDIADRLTPFLAALDGATGPVVLVSHAHTIRVAVAVLNGTRITELDWFELPNGGVVYAGRSSNVRTNTGVSGDEDALS